MGQILFYLDGTKNVCLRQNFQEIFILGQKIYPMRQKNFILGQFFSRTKILVTGTLTACQNAFSYLCMLTIYIECGMISAW